jgi:alpha-ketoglutarate-dependent taurine dioxygenase
VFGTSDRREVEDYCRSQGISCDWKPNGGLRTTQLCQAVARHPDTGAMLWFNQAHLFHVSALDPVVQEALLDIAGDERNLPRNVFYGDGAPIELEALAEIRQVLAEAEIRFPWRRDDILMLDNMAMMHGRTAFKGPRKVVVAMAEPHAEPLPNPETLPRSEPVTA